MECAEIKVLLSEYVDGTLDEQAREGVEKHLSGCNACTKELLSLRHLVEELGSLDAVKAPSDFLEQLNKRMKPSFRFEKIIQKLFVPLHKKVPLELAAATLMSILVFSILSIQQVERKLVQVPKDVTSENALEKETIARLSPTHREEAERFAAVPKETLARQPVDKPAMSKKEPASGYVGRALQSKVKPSSPVYEKPKGRKPSISVQTVQLTLIIKTKDDGAAYGLADTEETAPPTEKDLSEGLERKAPFAYSERKARVRPPDQVGEIERYALKEEKQATPLKIHKRAIQKDESGPALTFENRLISKVKQLIWSENGQVLSVKYDSETAQTKTIHGEIPTGRYDSFLNKLGHMATLKTPLAPLPDKNQDSVQILIKLTHSK